MRKPIIADDAAALAKDFPATSFSKHSFCMIPQDDLKWVMDQKPAVIRLFHECWLSDSYGSRWMQLGTKLKPTAFKEAKKRLSDQGLFVFKPEPSIRDGRSTVCWLVKNLHGSRVKDFWKETMGAETEPTVAPTASKVAPTATTVVPTATKVASTATKVAPTTSISPQTQAQQDFQDVSISSQQRLNNASITPQRSIEACYEEQEMTEALQALPSEPELVGEEDKTKPPELKPEQIRAWMMRCFFSRRLPYPGRERLEEWLFEVLVQMSGKQRDQLYNAFRVAERERPGASLHYLLRRALPKGFEMPEF